MRLWHWSGALALGLLFAGPVHGERYLVNAAAGNNGDGHVNNDDPDAFAEYSRVDGAGFEIYEASANASSGSVFASAARTDPLPFIPISTRAAAGIEETIHFDELPADSVTVTASLGAVAQAMRNVGGASASARLDLGFSCYTTVSFVAGGGGSTAGGVCGGNLIQGTTLQLVLTRDQILDANLELDIQVHVSAQLESLGGIDGSATVSGGLPLARGGTPVPGRVYLELDPPLAISFTGSQTFFPAPEPGAPLLAVVGVAVLAAARSAPRVRSGGPRRRASPRSRSSRRPSSSLTPPGASGPRREW
jgi:hypothetical protein